MDYKQQKRKWKIRNRKAMGVRRRLNVGGDRPRLSVFRSSKHISVQLIDDLKGITLAAASDFETGLAEQLAGKTKTERATVIGAAMAERAKAAGVEEVKFDRGSYLFHGRVKALAEAAREGGLKF
ncbi:MAG: 50S ribosomal protein L18 [Planctomycetota bacterium]|nr:MAG: 50S ribosomal protein L18 [Planctomycetota bacterium]